MTLLRNLIEKYYSKLFRESSVRELTEKCRQLAAGRSNVEFGEYAEPLDYRLIPGDQPLPEAGGTGSLLRSGLWNRKQNEVYPDADMMIAYDERRRFRLYGVDIRSFGKYNELFSVETGDALLREVTKRLSAIFGSNLYRINGDVFLGISLDHASRDKENDEMISRIQEAFRIPVKVQEAVITPDAFIGVCDYPANARKPEKLLECLQSAINYGKVPEHGVTDGIVIFNNRLLEIRRREGKILQLIRDSIHEGTLEVWYQPIYQMKAGRFTAAGSAGSSAGWNWRLYLRGTDDRGCGKKRTCLPDWGICDTPGVYLYEREGGGAGAGESWNQLVRPAASG